VTWEGIEVLAASYNASSKAFSISGSNYVDEPVLKAVSVYCGKEPMAGKVTDHYKRTPLIWVKP